LTRVRVLVAAALSTAIVGAVAPSATAGARDQMIRAINNVRGAHNRRAVRFSQQLSAAATAWARQLVRRNVLAHASLHPGQGEIIELHTGGRAQIRSTVVEWWNSAEHRTVMLNGRFRRAGAGRAVGMMDGRRCTIWVVRFSM
jgi:uncharacterized protein YkwD